MSATAAASSKTISSSVSGRNDRNDADAGISVRQQTRLTAIMILKYR